MNYQQTLDFFLTSLPMFHRTGGAAYKANLDNTLKLDARLGNPHRKFRSVHVAGTNGKGSVSHMLAAILQKAGYKTGLYTSPHLKDFRERIRINGKMIPKKEVVGFVEKHIDFLREIKPSFFEMTSALAFSHFASKSVDIAVIETGMGGRLDSTNIIDPLVSVITNIGLDHTKFLGTTLELIAVEKAGIIKPGRPVVIGEFQTETAEVFSSHAKRSDSRLFYADRKYHCPYSTLSADRTQVMNLYSNSELIYPNLATSLLGSYQRKNVPTVLQSVDVLNGEGLEIKKKAIYEGIREVKTLTGLRGRWDEIGYNPLIVCDAAHNAEGIKEIIAQIEQTPRKNLHMVFGMSEDKDRKSILTQLPTDAWYYFCKADLPRALDAEILEKEAGDYGLKGTSFPGVKEALQAAKEKALPEDMIFIGGSTFIVAEVL
jgi:dihydrofolate synthase/folylpolyglutamate synthase